jgi:hypothetical protein
MPLSRSVTALVQLDDGEARDFLLRLERPGDVDDAQAVAVVLDDGENRPLARQPADLPGIGAEVGGIDLQPRVERRVDRRCRALAERGQRRRRDGGRRPFEERPPVHRTRV